MLQYELYMRGIKTVFQTASLVKNRWTDAILVHKGLIRQQGGSFYLAETKLSDHSRDAIRHAVHYATFRKD